MSGPGVRLRFVFLPLAVSGPTPNAWTVVCHRHTCRLRVSRPASSEAAQTSSGLEPSRELRAPLHRSLLKLRQVMNNSRRRAPIRMSTAAGDESEQRSSTTRLMQSLCWSSELLGAETEFFSVSSDASGGQLSFENCGRRLQPAAGPLIGRAATSGGANGREMGRTVAGRRAAVCYRRRGRGGPRDALH